MSADPFSAILLDHLRRYPRMEVQDLYKLVYQASLGAEHAFMDPDVIHLRLMQELGGLVAGPDEPAEEAISADGRVLRVHLRPLVLRGLEPRKLSSAFFESAKVFRGTGDDLEQAWRVALDLARSGEEPFPQEAMETYFNERLAGGFEPVHHSQAYREAYHPAYRVVLREFWGG